MNSTEDIYHQMNSTEDIYHHQPNPNSTELYDPINGNYTGSIGKKTQHHNRSHIYSKGETVYTHGTPKRNKTRSKISKTSKRKNRKNK